MDNIKFKKESLSCVVDKDYTESKWYVVRTRSSYEERTEDFFRSCGLETFLPALHSKTYDNQIVTTVLSPNLVFVHVSAEKLLAIKNSNRWPYFLTLYNDRTSHNKKGWRRLLAISEKEMTDFKNNVDEYHSWIKSMKKLFDKYTFKNH